MSQLALLLPGAPSFPRFSLSPALSLSILHILGASSAGEGAIRVVA